MVTQMDTLPYGPGPGLTGRTGDDMADKPASRVIAKALKRDNGFVAQFALPGLVPDMVRQDGGRGGAIVYPTELAAVQAAREAALRVLDSRTVDTRKAGGYLRMTGAELGVALQDAELTPTEFAELYGVPQHRVMKWLHGEEDVPHSAHLVARLLAYEENYREARSITDRARAEGAGDGR